VVKINPKIKYDHPENLKYAWIVYPYPYEPVQEGNAMVYPKPDTLSRSLDIEWTVNLAPGRWTTQLLVEDIVRGLTASMRMGGYFTISKQGVKSGVYILSEYEGQTDIDYYASALCLIYGGDNVIPHYYSEECKHGLLPGKPKFISYGNDYYYVFTESGGYRLNFAGLELMEDFNGMFYDTPAFAPQAVKYINNCEYFVNNGKLHVLYTNKGNDRKFSAPIGGDYRAGAYLNDATRNTYSPVVGAIGADQIIFDEQSKGFRPYYPQAAEMGEFGETSGSAFIDAKALPAVPIAMQGGSGGQTYAVVIVDNVPYLYILNFYNVVDDGDLSGNGANSIINLSGCTGITDMKYFASNYQGSAFFYATDKAVYSFSPSSGATTGNLLYECQAGETVTCIEILFGHGDGGFPSAGNVLWIGVWDEVAKNGTLVEYEVDPYGGTARSQWGTMFAPGHANPYITSGYGKIKSICAK
jgi:hypothetical protein